MEADILKYLVQGVEKLSKLELQFSQFQEHYQNEAGILQTSVQNTDMMFDSLKDRIDLAEKDVEYLKSTLDERRALVDKELESLKNGISGCRKLLDDFRVADSKRLQDQLEAEKKKMMAIWTAIVVGIISTLLASLGIVTK